MAGSKTNYLENIVIDHILRNQAYTPASTVYCALFTVAPTDAGGGTEIETNGTPARGYARQSVTFTAASSGATANNADLTFGPCTSSNWGSCVAFAVFDAATTGNMLYWGDITSPKTVNVGDTAKILTGDLDITED